MGNNKSNVSRIKSGISRLPGAILMYILLTFLIALSGFLAVVTALLLTASFSKGQREKFPILTKLSRRRIFLVGIIVLFLLIMRGTNLAREIMVLPTLEYVSGPGGEHKLKADIEGVEVELEEAFVSYQQALRILKQIRYPLGQARALAAIGLVYASQGKLDEALNSYQQALEINKRIGYPFEQAQNLRDIGTVYAEQGRLEEALEAHQAELEIHKETGYKLGEADALTSTGFVYAEQGKPEEALLSYQKALKISEERGYQIGLAAVLTNIGNTYYQQGKLEDALHSYQAALEIDRQTGNTPEQAANLWAIGFVYAEQGKKEVALEHLRRARDMWLKHDFEAESLRKAEEKIRELEQED
jgi:tetratricopeptide (TPR) repeat protein